MNISKKVLWLFVVILGIEVGAGLYETIVIIPMWMGGGSDSVIKYYELYAANPQFALRSGEKFWMFFTPLVGLLAIATFLTSFKTSPTHRKWRQIGSGLTVFIVVVTFAWFVPNIMRLTFDVPNMTAEAITTTAKWWVNLNYIRCVLAVTAVVCVLKALSVQQDQSPDTIVKTAISGGIMNRNGKILVPMPVVTNISTPKSRMWP